LTQAIGRDDSDSPTLQRPEAICFDYENTNELHDLQ